VKSVEGRRKQPLSVDALMRTYQQDVDKKRLLVRDATSTRDRLLFVVEALRTLMADEGFVTLLRVAEDVAVNGSSAVIVL
jgi:ParB family transcriptional regulator, chromosome partitioning protein